MAPLRQSRTVSCPSFILNEKERMAVATWSSVVRLKNAMEWDLGYHPVQRQSQPERVQRPPFSFGISRGRTRHCARQQLEPEGK
jgi:hypothetical protein